MFIRHTRGTSAAFVLGNEYYPQVDLRLVDGKTMELIGSCPAVDRSFLNDVHREIKVLLDGWMPATDEWTPDREMVGSMPLLLDCRLKHVTDGRCFYDFFVNVKSAAEERMDAFKENKPPILVKWTANYGTGMWDLGVDIAHAVASPALAFVMRFGGDFYSNGRRVPFPEVHDDDNIRQADSRLADLNQRLWKLSFPQAREAAKTAASSVAPPPCLGL